LSRWGFEVSLTGMARCAHSSPDSSFARKAPMVLTDDTFAVRHLRCQSSGTVYATHRSGLSDEVDIYLNFDSGHTTVMAG
jgi:hypothetical protein